MWHKHKWELVGFSISAQGFLAPRGFCFEVYKCSKCGKLKTGAIRNLTEEEKLGMADSYRKQLEDKGE